MASIYFSVLDSSSGVIGLGGSGLGFYGSTWGSSVSTLKYQDSTYITDSNGTTNGGEARNVKYLGTVAGPNASGCIVGISPTSGTIATANSSQATLLINFSHTSAVKVQNAQLRIFDRVNINSPATGVITKVAEIVNFDNKAYATWVSNFGSPVVGANSCFGDAFWWGSPWPSGSVYGANKSIRPYYQNSVGVKFYNYTDYHYNNGSGNPDSAISALVIPGFDTVGGSGLIVPLLDSPGSGGKGLDTGVLTSAVPKYSQYIDSAQQASLLGTTLGPYNSGTYLANSYGGTGYDTLHTWRVALSASPLSIGSKTNYGLYVSLEYL
jgi:hypothetical protein